MKKCPFCAEEIQEEAIKCKHCGELLNAQAAKIAKTGTPWYFNDVILFFAFFAIGPFILPGVWKNPRNSLVKKIIVSVVSIGVTVWATVFLGQIMEKYYKQIMSLGV